MSGLNLTTLKRSVRAWVLANVAAGWKPVWADQNAPKPGPQEITLKMGPLSKIGRDVRGKVDPTTGKRSVLGTREAMIELRGFGPGATQVLEDIRALTDDDVADAAHVAAGFAVVDTTIIQNLTSLYGSQFKEVAMVEIRIRTHSLRESTDAEAGVGYIRSVDLEVTTKSPGMPDVVETLSVVTPAG